MGSGRRRSQIRYPPRLFSTSQHPRRWSIRLGKPPFKSTVGFQIVLSCSSPTAHSRQSSSSVQSVNMSAWWQVEVTFQEGRAHLGLETQRQWSTKRSSAPRRSCSAFSLVTLWTHDLSKSRKLKPRTAAWYPKSMLTFSDAIAAARREIWRHQISFMSRPRRDSIEIPIEIWNRMEHALAQAA